MADTKITALTALTGADPANDVIPIVDVSDTTMAASGTTKKISVNNILGASGTATLASATITGDLTVDTNTLKVDSVNNRVGVGTATPAVDLHIQAAGSASAEVRLASATRSYNIGSTGSGYGSANNLIIYDLTGAAERYRLDASGNHFWNNVGGVAGTAMTLNSTGLGVGTSSHTVKLGVVDTVNTFAATFRGNVGTDFVAIGTTALGASINAFTAGFGAATNLILQPNGGNVGIGVAPKSWLSSYKAIQLGYSTSLSSTTGTDFAGLSSNAYVDSVDSRWERIVSGYATQYYQNAGDGQHIWRIAGTAAADTAITWTNAMTLDASGNLGIGVTPSAWRSGARALQLGTNGYATLHEQSNGSTNLCFAAYEGSANVFNYRTTGDLPSRYAMLSGTHQWYTAPSGTAGNAITFTQAMTLDASGNLLVGKSVSLFSTVGVEASGTGFISATNSASTNASTNLSVYSTGAAAFRFYVGLGGTVYATNTTISAISDQRLKENVQDIDVGLGAILALKPRKFDWKAGKGKDIKGDRGFIAQEFEQVFPQLVDEWKDEAPEGEAPYKSVRQDLIPVLVKAIQELAAEVNALKNA